MESMTHSRKTRV